MSGYSDFFTFLSKVKINVEEIYKSTDNSNIGKSSSDKASIFLAECENRDVSDKKEPWYRVLHSTIFNNNLRNQNDDIDFKPSLKEDSYIAPRDATLVVTSASKFREQDGGLTKSILVEQQKQYFDRVSSMIANEAKIQGIDLSQEDITYWAVKVDNISSKYDIPEALLISIIGRETKFDKNVNSVNGAGPMQVVEISIRDFFPDAKGNWNSIYNQMNSKLLNDILYKKDENGNFIKGEDGNYVLKYKSPKELRDACAKDDELGMLVGLLCFEMKYVKAVAALKYGKATSVNVPKIIKQIKNNELKLNEQENRTAITNALKNYNSVFKTYASAVVDSLEQHGMNFEDVYFIT